MKAAEIKNGPGVETPLDIEDEIRQGLDQFSVCLTEFGSARFDESELSFINSIVGSELILFTGSSYCTVPECPGIYIFHDSHNRRRALYVGQASNLRKRIYSNSYVERVSWLQLCGVHIWFQFFKTDAELCDHYEMLLIEHLNPLANKNRSSPAFREWESERTQRIMEGLRKGAIRFWDTLFYTDEDFAEWNRKRPIEDNLKAYKLLHELKDLRFRS